MGRMTHILWKIKNVPNQQPVYNYIIPCHSPVIYRISPQLHVFFLPTYTDWDAGKCAGNHISKMIKKKTMGVSRKKKN